MRILLAAAAACALTMAAAPATAEAPPTKAEDGYLSNSFGKPLYTSAADAPGVSNCAEGCRGWAPFRPGPDDSAEGEWSMITLPDGSKQWAFKSMPVYTHNQDIPGVRTVGHEQEGWNRIPAS